MKNAVSVKDRLKNQAAASGKTMQEALIDKPEKSRITIKKAWHVPCSVVIENTAVLDCLDCFFDLFRRQYQGETDISFS